MTSSSSLPGIWMSLADIKSRSGQEKVYKINKCVYNFIKERESTCMTLCALFACNSLL